MNQILWFDCVLELLTDKTILSMGEILTCKTYGKYKVRISKWYSYNDYLVKQTNSKHILLVDFHNPFKYNRYLLFKIKIQIIYCFHCFLKIEWQMYIFFFKSKSRTRKCSKMLWGLKTLEIYLSSTIYTTWDYVNRKSSAPNKNYYFLIWKTLFIDGVLVLCLIFWLHTSWWEYELVWFMCLGTINV